MCNLYHKISGQIQVVDASGKVIDDIVVQMGGDESDDAMMEGIQPLEGSDGEFSSPKGRGQPKKRGRRLGVGRGRGGSRIASEESTAAAAPPAPGARTRGGGLKKRGGAKLNVKTMLAKRLQQNANLSDS